MKSYTTIVVAIFILCSCCESRQNVAHKGGIVSPIAMTIDSIEIKSDGMSGYGNFFMSDDQLLFADSRTCKLYTFNTDGELLETHFAKGHGANEFPSFLYMCPIVNDTKSIIAVDESNNCYYFDTKTYHVKKLGVVHFDWEKAKQSDLSSPSLYKLPDMYDMGMTFIRRNDTTIISPIEIMDRLLSDKKQRYKSGHILAEINLNTMAVAKVFGKFPKMYEEHPNANMEFFQYCANGDTLYINHTIDSLIYVYEYPDRLLYTMGYELKHLNRDYTESWSIDSGVFYDNLKKCGFNTGLWFCKETGLLFRTAVPNSVSTYSLLQVYQNTNLIGSYIAPPYFKMLGYINGVYYGVRMTPIEINDKLSFMVYKIYF